MQAKALEIRDEATCIPVLCVNMNPAIFTSGKVEEHIGQRYLLRRCGYPCDGRPNILMTKMSADGEPAWNDPHGWARSRTMFHAHDYIIENWATLKDGDVVDVQFILGETQKPKVSERVEHPL